MENSKCHVNFVCRQLTFSVFIVCARGQRIEKFHENTNREEFLPGAEAGTLFYILSEIYHISELFLHLTSLSISVVCVKCIGLSKKLTKHVEFLNLPPL